MSLIRSIRRADARRRGTFATYKAEHAKLQPTELHDTYYRTLHPTKGWQRVAYARDKARQVASRIRLAGRLTALSR